MLGGVLSCILGRILTTTGYAVLLLGIPLNSINMAFGFFLVGGKKMTAFMIACSSWFLH